MSAKQNFKVTLFLFLICILLSNTSAQILRDGNCSAFLDAATLHNVITTWGSNSFDLMNPRKYLYITKVFMKDNGESESRDPADIGLVVYGGPHLKDVLNQVRLYGPVYEGPDEDGTFKYEWEDYCIVYYNNYCIADLTYHNYEYIRLLATEGDHQDDYPIIEDIVDVFAPSALKDDIVFDAMVSISNLSSLRELTITGNCDIPGKCAELTLALRTTTFQDEPLGLFWNKDCLSRSGVMIYHTDERVLIKNLTKKNIDVYVKVYTDYSDGRQAWTEWIGPYRFNSYSTQQTFLSHPNGWEVKGYWMNIYAISCDGRYCWEEYKDKALYIGTERPMHYLPDFIFTFY